MYQALYRKYRPKTFDDVVGQDVIVKTLKNSIKNDMVSHAYLFCGPRGTGKTSIAKIFAKILNCTNLKDLEPCNECVSCIQVNTNQNIDIIEIDAASNNGVDEIREIRNKITLVPANSKYKIYIIDEVHMLSGAAFNALLKTTILSRCQRFDYKKISDSKIVERLKFIAKSEKINISDEALFEIARLSDGGMRDSISLLEQALAYANKKIEISDIHDINGTLMPEEIDDFILKILNNDLVGLLSNLEEYDNNGKNMVKIVQELINRLKDCLIFIKAPKFINDNSSFLEKVKELNVENKIYQYIKSFSTLINEMRNSNDSKLLLEIELIKNIDSEYSVSPETTEREEEPVKIKTEDKLLEKKKSNTKSKVKKEEKTSVDEEKLEELKQIRINNALCKFSQRERERAKEELIQLNEFINDTLFSKNISLIEDGELKAVSDDYLMFIFNTDLLADTFNHKLIEIEDMLEKCLNKKYHPIAINMNDWNFIKEDYNKNKEKYQFKEENVTLDQIFNTSKKEKAQTNVWQNEIDEMFDDIIEYED